MRSFACKTTLFAAAGAVAVLLARFVMVKEAQKPHQTPAERPPTEHQVKSELAELRNRIDHANDQRRFRANDGQIDFLILREA